MRLFIDLNTGFLTAALGATAGISELNFKRGADNSLEVQFFRDRTVVELSNDATGRMQMKPQGKYDAGPLVNAGSWTKNGTGENAVYTFGFSFITGALDALFQVDGDPANDVPSIMLMAEIQWTANRLTGKTQTFIAAIENDINRDTD
ncbi:MAG TPA: hypothetical protein VGI59_09895 [Candidatus Udaeobacter sp.]|jgi:hypothetical protein